MGALYLYDGSFSGLICTLKDIFITKIQPEAIAFDENAYWGSVIHGLPGKSRLPVQKSFLTEERTVKTDENAARQYLAELHGKLRRESLNCIYSAFLSSLKDREMKIYHYIREALQLPAPALRHLYNPHIKALYEISRKVLKEAHIMKGFIRFSVLEDGSLYSRIDPDHFILPLLRRHFSKRFSQNQWIIHDCGRRLALIYREGRTEIVSVLKTETPGADKEESLYRELWKTFFRTIAVRENARQQKQYMPQRYWKHMTEFQPPQTAPGTPLLPYGEKGK